MSDYNSLDDQSVNTIITEDLGHNSQPSGQNIKICSDARQKLTVGSLFAGIGGFDLGLERAGGFEIKWQVEIDEFCQRVLAKHWPNVQRYGDIRSFAASESVDVICGGFPCQPFSSAARGRNASINLWPEMLRVIACAMPSWVIAENVPHIDGPALETVLSNLEAIGYEVWPIEIPACAFDKDHIRRRLWILGHSDCDSKPKLSINAEMARMSQLGSLTGSMGTQDGISGRMDRLKALGNAVVPQIVEWIGNQILAFERSVEVSS